MRTSKKRVSNSNKSRTYKNLYVKLGRIIKNRICLREDGVYEPFEKQFNKTNPLYDVGNVENNLVKMFKRKLAPTNLRPQDDFYTYINYEWLKDTALEARQEKKYYTQIDDFRVVQEKVYHELIDFVKDYIKSTKSKKATAVANVYHSLLKLDSVACRTHMRSSLKSYHEKLELDNVWKFVAHINENEIISWACPIRWSVRADTKNVKVFKDYIDFPTLGLYDPQLYLDDNGQTDKYIAYKRGVKRKYLAFISKVYHECLGIGHGLIATDVFDVERDILMTMGCDPLKGESPIGYNVINASEALPKYGFDWINFSKYLGYSEAPATFICSSLSFLKCISKLLTSNYNSKKWQSFWKFIYLRQMMRFDRKLLPIFYEFNGSFLQGMPIQFPKEIYPVFGLSLCFNTFLSQQYTAKFYGEGRLQYATSIAKDTLEVFKRIVGRNTWLSQPTKKYAIHKLNLIKLDIGQPTELTEDPVLEYSPNDAWGNMIKICLWRKTRLINLKDRKVVDIPEIDWSVVPPKLIGKQCYIVNAMYTPSLNNIYIPLAYLQPPFIDLANSGIEKNLAHIGYTLCHEMSHALDNWGSQYDAQGNMKDWWTPGDKKKFKAIQDGIIKQYEAYASADGIDFDATIGIGEDLADISGLAICEEYLRDYHKNHKTILAERKISFELFYVIFAQQQRQHVYKQAVAAQLKTNPHPMDKYRTNVPLSRLKLFRSIYQVEKGDGMYWPSQTTVW